VHLTACEAGIAVMFAPVFGNASVTMLCPSRSINLTWTYSSVSGTKMSGSIEVADVDTVILAKPSSTVLASALIDDVVATVVI
jgi:hypothetical protein